MIVQSKKTNVNRSSGMAKNNFTIKASSHAFKILSSNLYSDPQRAIIREISTNALDAHKESGVTKPFSIHVPTLLDPFFSVRDYGTGLNHEQVTRLYTTYFDSTKNDSNDSVGGLGLGSKSPLGYCDLFNVNAFDLDGTRHYAVTINEDGLPEINFLGKSEEPNEETGLEVIVPLNNPEREVREWTRRMVNILTHFPQGSFVTSGEDINIQIEDARQTAYSIYSEECDFYIGDHGHSRIYARMGCVIYPISSSRLDVSSFGGSRNMIIEFPIGQLSISPNREELHYDGLTVDNIKARLDAIKDYANSKLKTVFDRLSDDEKICQFIGNEDNDLNNQLHEELSSIHSVMSITDEYFIGSINQQFISHIANCNVEIVKILLKHNSIKIVISNYSGSVSVDASYNIAHLLNDDSSINEHLYECICNPFQMKHVEALDEKLAFEYATNPDKALIDNPSLASNAKFMETLKEYKDSDLFVEIKDSESKGMKQLLPNTMNQFSKFYRLYRLSLSYRYVTTHGGSGNIINAFGADRILLLKSAKGYVTAVRKYIKQRPSKKIIYADEHCIDDLLAYFDKYNINVEVTDVTEHDDIVAIKNTVTRKARATYDGMPVFSYSGQSFERCSFSINALSGDWLTVLISQKEFDSTSIKDINLLDLIIRNNGSLKLSHNGENYNSVRVFRVSEPNKKALFNDENYDVISMSEVLDITRTQIKASDRTPTMEYDFVEKYNIDSTLFEHVGSSLNYETIDFGDDKINTVFKVLFGVKNQLNDLSQKIHGELTTSDITLEQSQIDFIEKVKQVVYSDMMIIVANNSYISYTIKNSKNVSDKVRISDYNSIVTEYFIEQIGM